MSRARPLSPRARKVRWWTARCWNVLPLGGLTAWAFQAGEVTAGIAWLTCTALAPVYTASGIWVYRSGHARGQYDLMRAVAVSNTADEARMMAFAFRPNPWDENPWEVEPPDNNN